MDAHSFLIECHVPYTLDTPPSVCCSHEEMRDRGEALPVLKAP